MRKLLAIALLLFVGVSACEREAFAVDEAATATAQAERTAEEQWVAAIQEIMERDGVDAATANDRLANLLRWHAAVEEIVKRDGVTAEVASIRLARLLAGLMQTSSAGSWKSVALAAGWEEWRWPWVQCIINRESGGKPSAISATHDYGLMQMNRVHLGWLRAAGVITVLTDLLDPYTNLYAARLLFEQNGTGPWRATRGNC